MSLRVANAPYLIEALGVRALDALPGYYLDGLAVNLAVYRKQRAALKRKERARGKK